MFRTIIKRHYGNLAVDKLKIKDILIKKHVCNQAKIEGWVRSVRKHKHATFVDVNDGSTIKCLQVVIDPNKFKSDISYGASICVTGNIIATKKHRDGIEMQCNDVSVLGSYIEDYVFPKHADYHDEHLRMYVHLRPKEDAVAAVLRTRNCLEMEIHNYFQEKNFLHIHTPILTSNDCEGAGETFVVVTDVKDYIFIDDIKKEIASDGKDETSQLDSKVDSNKNLNSFFGKSVYLTVSGQLHLEACALGLGNVYTLNPAFRADPSMTRKHLSEFRMLEVEVAFTQSLNDIIELMEDSIKCFLNSTIEKCEFDINHYHDVATDEHKIALNKALNKDYLRISYREVLDILQRQTDKIKTFVPKWGDDFNNEHEVILMEYTEFQPVFIENFPKQSKPFYMFENSDGKTVSAVDLIFPFCGELCGGSVREHRLDILIERLEYLNIRQQYEWYIDLRRHGNAPHCGFGLGFDRLLRFLLGVNNIRDVVPFPRWPRSCVL